MKIVDYFTVCKYAYIHFPNADGKLKNEVLFSFDNSEGGFHKCYFIYSLQKHFNGFANVHILQMKKLNPGNEIIASITYISQMLKLRFDLRSL